METVLAAVISAVSAIVVCIISNGIQQNKTRALVEYRLNELTKRVEKHNHVVERVYQLEQDNAVLSEKVAVANHRIDDLEEVK